MRKTQQSTFDFEYEIMSQNNYYFGKAPTLSGLKSLSPEARYRRQKLQRRRRTRLANLDSAAEALGQAVWPLVQRLEDIFLPVTHLSAIRERDVNTCVELNRFTTSNIQRNEAQAIGYRYFS